MTDPSDILLAPPAHGVPLVLIAAKDWEEKRRDLSSEVRSWADANGFKAQPGRFLVIPGGKGEMKQVLAGEDASDRFAVGKLARSLPPGTYAVSGNVPNAELLALGADRVQRRRAA